MNYTKVAKACEGFAEAFLTLATAFADGGPQPAPAQPPTLEAAKPAKAAKAPSKPALAAVDPVAIRAKFVKFVEDKGREEGKALLAKFGAEKLANVAADKLPAFDKAMDEVPAESSDNDLV